VYECPYTFSVGYPPYEPAFNVRRGALLTPLQDNSSDLSSFFALLFYLRVNVSLSLIDFEGLNALVFSSNLKTIQGVVLKVVFEPNPLL